MKRNGAEERRALVLALPILPGKEEEWRRFVQEVEGPLLGEYERLRRRMGLGSERVWIAQGPRREVALAYAEVASPEEAARTLAESGEPFDVWFREKLLELHDCDVARLSSRGDAELIFAYPEGKEEHPKP